MMQIGNQSLSGIDLQDLPIARTVDHQETKGINFWLEWTGFYYLSTPIAVVSFY